MSKTNRLILGVLELNLEFNFGINSSIYMGEYFLRLQTKQQILILKSSIIP